MAFERMEPFGGQIDDLRSVIGHAATINTVRRMFGGADNELIVATQLIPWYEAPPEKLLHDPADDDYDANEHASAIRRLLMGKATKANE